MSVTKRDGVGAELGHIHLRIQPKTSRVNRFEEESAAPDNHQQRLEASIRQSEELLEIHSSLIKKVASLELELEKANELAFYDVLTGLANRRLLFDRFVQAAALADRHHQQLALLFFDVNNFKCVNDNLGHNAGDTVLQLMAARLLSTIRKSDTACRYGGDEFIVLLTEISNYEQVVVAVKKISADLAPPYSVGGYSLRLTVSYGLAIYPKDAQCFKDLVQLSDRSMFKTKSDTGRQSARLSATNICLNDAAPLATR